MKHIKDILEEMAPSAFKESYDNVGLMVGDLDDKVNTILVALDCTMEVIEEAKSLGSNLIITHHPLLFKKPTTITTETLVGRKIIKLIQNKTNVYCSHTNLDIVSGGLNDIVTEILGFNSWEIIEGSLQNISNNTNGIGRLVTLEKQCTLKELCEHVKATLKIDCLKYAGKDNMLLNKIAIVNGSGEDYFNAAKLKGADCIVTGDTTYHYVSDYIEENLAVIDAGHFETEWPSMQVAARKIERKIKEYGFHNKIVLSKVSQPIYKFL